MNLILVLISVLYCFSIGWVILGFSKLKKKEAIKLGQTNKHYVSVIIPVRNEEKSILNCLKSLQKQDYNIQNFEIIVVNDHSTDNTKTIVTNFIVANNLDIQFIELTHKKSKKEALKLGVENAKFEIIATTDADCTLPEKWLKNISEQFNSGINMLLGPILFKESKGFLSIFQQLDMLAMQGVEFGTLGFQQPILNNAANLSYTKTAYNLVNGFDSFDTPSGDDVFLLEKFKTQQLRIKGLLHQDFVVETTTEKTFSGFLNQRLRWASKSKYYKDKLLVFISAITLFQNLALIFIYFGVMLVEKYNGFFVILLVSKWLIDFILLFLVASFFNRKKVLIYFMPIQIIYPIYIVVIWMASMIKKFDWKGREY